MSQEFAITVVQQLVQAGYIAYWAGGCVRDLLLGESASDFDVATNATPAQVREVFGERKTLAVGESFGVMIVLGAYKLGEKVEVATFRSDGQYVDGRRPETVRFTTAEEDARRRDFTINGMFYDPLTRTVHDFVGGEADLRGKVIRAIGQPRDRMREDKLRMLRAVRFAAKLDYRLDDDTAQAIREMAAEIHVVSVERIAVELRKMLGHPSRAVAMTLCRDLGLLEQVLPELTWAGVPAAWRWEQTLRVLQLLENANAETGMAALLAGVPVASQLREREDNPATGTVQAICRRLKLSHEQADHVVWLCQQRGSLRTLPTQSLAVVKTLLSHEWFADLQRLELAEGTAQGSVGEEFEWIREFLQRTPASVLNPPELLTGRDLIAAGFKPGPQFKGWLAKVRAAQLNEEITTKAEALELVRSEGG